MDIDHLDATIQLFNGSTDHKSPAEYVINAKAKTDTKTRFVLPQLRDASGPLTSRDITLAWCEDLGLVTDDEIYAVLRKRIGACSKQCALRGLVHDRGWSGDHGESGTYKLWVMARK